MVEEVQKKRRRRWKKVEEKETDVSRGGDKGEVNEK